MNAGRTLAAALGLIAVIAVAACSSTPQRPNPPTSTTLPPVLTAPAPVPGAVPDAVPRVEPRSRYGNPPFYEVFGKR